jgi:hypothetical protein
VTVRRILRFIGWISGFRLAMFLSCIWAGVSLFTNWPRLVEILMFIPLIISAIAIERWFWNWGD